MTEPCAGRLERAKAALRERGIDVLVVGPSADLRYLTGIDAHLSERMNLLVLPTEGRPAFVVPRLEASNVAGREALLDVLVWQETEAPAELVAHRVGSSAKVAAVGDQLHSVFLLRLQEALPGLRWLPAGPVLRDLRMLKDAAEVATMREAARRTDEAWAAFVESETLVGLTERQAMDRLMRLTTERGLEPSFGTCASGPNSAHPHHATGTRVIEPCDVVLFDWGGSLDGYQSDMTRTVVAGAPSEEFRRVYETVLRANEAAFAAVRPGATCESIDRAARRVIEEAGYGPHFIHRVGHGLGLDVHEEPYLVAGNALPLEPGMVFSDEPGIYLESRFGVRIEDTVICTEDGAERINSAPRDLVVMD
jgi:Xaa-Pro aminopeptidase